MKKEFYRVANTATNQGLWYDADGTFTGLIHTEFKFCTNNELQMPFDKEIIGWLSATDTLENLWFWFTKEDIEQLEKHGWFITIYEAEKYRFHNNHWVICQETSIVNQRLPLVCVGVTDKELLETYMWGFKDELDSRISFQLPFINEWKKNAYELGRADAIIGDEISSSDLQTNDEIISRIKC
jgi:hypothetical protein